MTAGVVAFLVFVWAAGAAGVVGLNRYRVANLRRELREAQDMNDFLGQLVASRDREIVDAKRRLVSFQLETTLDYASTDGVDSGNAEPGNLDVPKRKKLLFLSEREACALSLAVSFVEYADSDVIRDRLGVEPNEWDLLVDRVKSLPG